MTYSVFNANCSIPAESVNFVTSPNMRGTMDIIWTCAGVLLACIYTILHFNLPWSDHHWDSDYNKMRPYLRFCAPLHYSLLTLLAPEYLYGAYLTECYDVWKELQALHLAIPGTCAPRSFWQSIKASFASRDKDLERHRYSWTLTHIWFAEMGGFVVRLVEAPDRTGRYAPTGLNEHDHDGDNATKPVDRVGDADTPLAPTALKTTIVNVSASSTDDVEYGNPTQDPQAKRRPLHLTALVMRIALEEKLLSSEPVPEQKILALSKGDWLGKALVAFQLIQFTMVLITRLVERLPISALEVSTASFAICSLLAYCFVLPKPKNVTTTIVLNVDESGYARIENLLLLSNVEKIPADRLATSQAQCLDRDSRFKDRPRLSGVFPDTNFIGRATSYFIGTVFGAIHLAGWNLDFPNRVDQWLWRSAALATTIIPLYYLAAVAAYNYDSLKDAAHRHIFHAFSPGHSVKEDSDQQTSMHGQTWSLSPVRRLISKTIRPVVVVLKFLESRFAYHSYWMAAIAYVLGRVILLVEMIRMLFYLPPDAFRTVAWPSSMPHLG